MADVAFHRPDREFPERAPQTEIAILIPPTIEGPATQIALILQYLLIGVAALAILSLSVTQIHDQRIVEYSLLIAALAAVGALAMRSLGTGRRHSLRAERRRYYDYLQQQEGVLRRAADAQRNIDERLYPTTTSIATLVADRRFLWERRSQDPDFMSICAGRGRLPLNCPARLDVDESRAGIYDPLLLLGARTLVEHFTTLPDGAVTVDLRDCSTVAVSGDPDRIRPIARSIIVQATVLHAPLDLHVMGFLTPEGQAEWEWLKWLPHVRPTDDRGRLCALTDDVSDFTAMLAAEIAPREEALRKANAARTIGIPTPRRPSEMPHLLVLIDAFSLQSPLASVAPLVEAARRGRSLGITTVMVVPDRQAVPPFVDVIINARRQMASVQYAAGLVAAVEVRPDAVSLRSAEEMARAMTPLRLDEEKPREELAGTARLVDLLGLTDAAAIDPARGWRPRARSSMLRTPIGIGAGDTQVVLDIKDAAAGGNGPHGLVAGSAGSGKSELIRTIITGLATAHSPEVLTIACLDVEGAGTFEEFLTLPHLAGIMGGLLTDDSAVEMMRTSLISERERRSGLLAAAGTPNNVRAYQKQREQNASMEPIPTLLVIVDDAGRLMSGRRDVVELFADLAAANQNAGIHLLLCGRSFDGWSLQVLEGLLRYRICLHVDSADESGAILGSADAYNLPAVPGAAFLKTDGGQLERFLVARISAPYGEGGQSGNAADEVRLFTAIPHRAAAEQGGGAAVIEPTYSEMDVIVARLAGARDGVPARQIFVPPEAPVVTLGAVLTLAASTEHAVLTDPQPFGRLRVPIGLVLGGDDATPDRPLFLDISDGTHTGMVGAAGMGRSTFLHTVLGALILTHSPDELRIAGVDLGGGGMAGFAAAPHVITLGGIQPDTGALSVVTAVRRLIDRRQATTQERGAATFAELAGTPGVDTAHVVVALDDVSAMGADALDGLSDIVRRGSAYGVSIIATAGSWLELPADVRTALANRMELRLKVPRHSVIDAAAAEAVPRLPGQGLIPAGTRVQIAIPCLDDAGDAGHLGEAVIDLVTRATAAWSARRPERTKSGPASPTTGDEAAPVAS